jgi:hypothetical protein
MGAIMETTEITSAKNLPQHMRRAAKAALAVGAIVQVSKDGEQLRVQFPGGDLYYFDPENVTMHALELLDCARHNGFVEYVVPTMSTDGKAWPLHSPLIVRSVFSAGDVRIQIGASKWFQDFHKTTHVALRRAICYAFSSYYDEAIASYTEAS